MSCLQTPLDDKVTENFSAFFQADKGFPKFVWKPSEDSSIYLGSGSTSRGDGAFGGQAFHPTSCQNAWMGFPAHLYFYPAILKLFPWKRSLSSLSFPKFTHLDHLPSQNRWIQLILDAKDKIKKGDFQKVVLSRQTCLTFSDPITASQIWNLFNQWGDKYSVFLLQLDPSTLWAGATPENLFSRKEGYLFTEALGATKIKQESWKESHHTEFYFIKKFLEDQLQSCCSNIEWSQLREKTFENLQHLYQKAKASLNKILSDQELISLFHPTPALGGYPKEASLSYILNNESFSRGWYGSPIGFFTQHSSHCCVGIRSLLLRGNRIYLFSGAGITKDSDPLKEWKELDRKIDHILKRMT